MEIGLNSSEKRIIQEIVQKYLANTEFKSFIFGSRATGKGNEFSDVDIGVEGSEPLPVDIKFELEDAFEESDLPYVVEIVDFSKVSDQFKNIAKSKIIELG